MNEDPREPDYSSQQYVNTLVHFYRGELGRMMVWRQRFDATTNWSVLATASLTAFGASNPPMTSEVMLINVFVLSFFAFLEGRRYRFYDAYRARVRMLEVHFIAPTLLGQDRKLLQGPWREELTRDLMMPSFKCSLAFALGRRFRHLYFALHGFVLLSWSALLAAHTSTLSEWIQAFRVGNVPGLLVLALVIAYLAVLAVVIVRSGALLPSSSEMENRYSEIRWKYRIEE